MDELLKKKIIIRGAEQSADGKKIKITGDDKQGYEFFCNKQDGTITKSYEQYSRGFTIGMEVGVAYKSIPVSFVNKQGRTINYNRNDVAFFIDPKDVTLNQNDGRPTYSRQGNVVTPNSLQTPLNPVAPLKTANLAPQPTIKRDFEAEAIGKVRHAFMLEAYKQGKQLNSQLVQEIDGWVQVVMSGELEDLNIELEDMPPSEIEVIDIPYEDLSNPVNTNNIPF